MHSIFYGIHYSVSSAERCFWLNRHLSSLCPFSYQLHLISIIKIQWIEHSCKFWWPSILRLLPTNCPHFELPLTRTINYFLLLNNEEQWNHHVWWYPSLDEGQLLILMKQYCTGKKQMQKKAWYFKNSQNIILIYRSWYLLRFRNPFFFLMSSMWIKKWSC